MILVGMLIFKDSVNKCHFLTHWLMRITQRRYMEGFMMPAKDKAESNLFRYVIQVKIHQALRNI